MLLGISKDSIFLRIDSGEPVEDIARYRKAIIDAIRCLSSGECPKGTVSDLAMLLSEFEPTMEQIEKGCVIVDGALLELPSQ